MKKLENNFILSYLLNEKADNASIFISKAYTTIEKYDSDKNKLEEKFNSIKDDSTTNILIKVVLFENDFNKDKSLDFLQKLQDNKKERAEEYKSLVDSSIDKKLLENYKYFYKKALDIKVKDLNMDIVEKEKYSNKNVTKKKYEKKDSNKNKKNKDNDNKDDDDNKNIVK